MYYNVRLKPDLQTMRNNDSDAKETFCQRTGVNVL